jgi:predicted RNA-binding protein YlxR (DUF448 family)
MREKGLEEWSKDWLVPLKMCVVMQNRRLVDELLRLWEVYFGSFRA